MNEDSKLYDDNADQITLTLEDGSELVCDVIAIFPVDGKNYIALLPQGDDPDTEIFLYRFEQKGEDDVDLINIEDDEEFDAVSDAFDELLDNAEFDEMFEE
ncbi:MAG: DUF1292 domain-containing protein [Lachnospiraceae bacterium]|nr:DUF1292 domain-containing protein [Lachnospiraceae bacterium]